MYFFSLLFILRAVTALRLQGNMSMFRRSTALFTITDRADAYPPLNTFINFVLSGAEAGTGFILAAFILTAAYRKLNSAKVPASFRGFPAMLVYLGLISMAVYARR